jgi:hypothetical protein
MAFIFNDTLEVTLGSGLYTLQGYTNNTWTDIHSISGATSGSLNVNAANNTIKLDTSVFLSGQTYDFRWVDSHGVVSNVSSLTVNGYVLIEPSVQIDANDFPQFNISIKVGAGSGNYELHLINDAGTQPIPVGPAELAGIGAADPQNFSINVPLPIRGSDYGKTFSFQFVDTISGQASPMVAVTQPPVNVNASKYLTLTISSSAGNIVLGGTANNGGGTYRLEMRDSGGTPVSDKDFADVLTGTLSQTFSLTSLGLTAGQAYSFLLFDQAQVVSNLVTITV